MHFKKVYNKQKLLCLLTSLYKSYSISFFQVKVDAKTKTLLDEYINKKKSRTSGVESEDKEKKENGDKEENETKLEEDLDEFTKREDRVAKAGLDAIMREYAEDLSKKMFMGTVHIQVQSIAILSYRFEGKTLNTCSIQNLNTNIEDIYVAI